MKQRIKQFLCDWFGFCNDPKWVMTVYSGFNTSSSKPTFNIESGRICQTIKSGSFTQCLESFYKFTDENKAYAFIAQCKFMVPISGRYYIRSRSKQGNTVSFKNENGFIAVRNIPGSVKSYLDNDGKDKSTVVGECLLTGGVVYTMQVRYWCIGESQLELYVSHEGIENDIDSIMPNPVLCAGYKHKIKRVSS